MTKEERRRAAALKKQRNVRIAKQGVIALMVVVVTAVGFVVKGS